MSERSRLVKRVLETWDQSDEGRDYLNWLLQPEAAGLDGGDVLREAVLDVVEDDDHLDQLRSKRAKSALDNFFVEAQLPDDTTSAVRASASELSAGFAKLRGAIKKRVRSLREIRRTIDKDRLETLVFVSHLLSMDTSDQVSELRRFRENYSAAVELAARIAALSRTSVEPVDVESEWRKSATADTSFSEWLQCLDQAAEGWSEYVSDQIDQHYSYELVARLEQIVERASALDQVRMKVSKSEVRKLFREAHEAYLYGFDVASIALCRGLIEHALKDRLHVPANLYLKLLGKPDEDSLIHRAESNGLIGGPELESVKLVARAGNDAMHNVSSPRRKAAQEVLVCTRMTLNHLYPC
jgi:hypothetical protein